MTTIWDDLEAIERLVGEAMKKLERAKKRTQKARGRKGGGGTPPVTGPSYSEFTGTVDSTTIIANPGVGLQTTQATLATVSNPRGTPIRNMTYRRHCSEIEATEGVRDFAVVENIFDLALAMRQKVNFRFIWGEPDVGVPAWVTAYGGYVAECDDNGRSSQDRYPDMSNTSVQAAFRAQVAAFDALLGNHPALGYVDAFAAGVYGEGHFNGTYIISKSGGAPGTVGQQIPMPSNAAILEHLNTFIEELPQCHFTPASVDRDDLQLPSTVQAIWTQSNGLSRMGARADGIAYRPSVGSPGVQMGTLYPPTVSSSSTKWQTGPYAGEIYSTLAAWISNSWDYASSLDWVADNHFCLLNTKGLTYDSALNADMDAMLLRIGYRLTVTSARHLSRVNGGESLTINFGIANNGNSPLYDSRYVLAIKLTNQANGKIYRIESAVSPNILPGSSTPSVDFTIPTYVEGGDYDVAVGVVDERGVADIQLAQSGRDANGWYPMTELEVVNASPTAEPTKRRALFGGSNYFSLAGTYDMTKASGHDAAFYFEFSIPAGTAATTQAIWCKGDLGATGQEYSIYQASSNSKINFRVSNTSNNFTVSADNFGVTPTNEVIKVYCWIDNTAKEIGIIVNNGTPNTTSFTGTVRNGTNAMRIGADTIGRQLANGATINNCRKWRKKLSAQEITDIFTKSDYVDLTTDHHFGLQAAWDFDETSGTRYDSHGIRNLTDNGSVSSIAE